MHATAFGHTETLLQIPVLTKKPSWMHCQGIRIENEVSIILKKWFILSDSFVKPKAGSSWYDFVHPNS